MMRRLWLAACVLVPLLVLSVPTLYVAGIWTGAGRLGGIATVLLFTSIPIGLAFALWTDTARPDPLLPRKHRRELQREEARIRLERAIADMEREAGIR